MSGRVIHLVPPPEKSCGNVLKGRCLREERQNPGAQAAWRCPLLLQLEGEYDRALNMAEDAGMNETQAANLVAARLEAAPLSGRCGGTVRSRAGAPGDTVACDHLLGLVCLRLVPKCQGNCRHYAPAATGNTD